MKKIFISMLTLVTTMIISSCNKCNDLFPQDCKTCYEELYGEWTLNYFATNGIDSVNYFDSIYQTKCTFNFQFYNKDIDFSFGPNFGIAWGSDKGLYYFLGCEYSRITKESYLPVSTGGFPLSNSGDPFKNWRTSYWKINHLAATDLQFQLVVNGNIYEMHFNK